MTDAVIFDYPVMHHARGAWGNRTHSGHGTVTIDGVTLRFDAYRFFTARRDAATPDDIGTTYEVVLTHINSTRELTAAKWLFHRDAARKAFIRAVRDMMEAALTDTAVEPVAVEPVAVEPVATPTPDGMKESDARQVDAIAAAIVQAGCNVMWREYVYTPERVQSLATPDAIAAAIKQRYADIDESAMLLRIYRAAPDGVGQDYVGRMALVFGNGDDELISDYSYSDETRATMERIAFPTPDAPAVEPVASPTPDALRHAATDALQWIKSGGALEGCHVDESIIIARLSAALESE